MINLYMLLATSTIEQGLEIIGASSQLEFEIDWRHLSMTMG